MELGPRLIDEASRALLGYFVYVWYGQYFEVILENFLRWGKEGLIETVAKPTESGKYSMVFDFRAINLEKILYINGIYFYILSCHKGANHRLMNRYDGKQVLYLRGYDFEQAVHLEHKVGIGLSTVNTAVFTGKLGELLGTHFHVFKVLSPKDVYWETVAAQRYFHTEFADMIHLAQYPFCSVYLNALHWKQDVLHLLDRMDHFIVYVSSITESVLWELEQLDTDERRDRVTVVFDDKAIKNKDVQAYFNDQMQAEYGDKLVWKREGSAPAHSVSELRAWLATRFLVSSPAEFEKDIERHRRRIAEGAARLAPGARETHLDFRFHPALDPEKVAELRKFSAAVQEWIAGRFDEKGIDFLPLFLNQIQLRIFMTLLLGEHAETGRALASYAAVMQGALDYYNQPGSKVGDLSAERREFHLDALQEHRDMANHISLRMLAYGESHQFDDFTHVAGKERAVAFDRTKTVVDRYYRVVQAGERDEGE